MDIIPLKQLKENVAAFYEKGQFNFEKQMSNVFPSYLPKNAFEIVSEKDGSPNKVLISCEGQYSVLFRGQSEDFHRVIPHCIEANILCATSL